MDKICKDVRGIVVSFCTVSDVLTLSEVCKDYNTLFNQSYIWLILGKRDHPYLQITNKESYKISRPMYIPKHRVINAINRNNWAKGWYNSQLTNPNNKPDHITPSYIYSIMKTMEHVHNLRILKQTLTNSCMDWKICVSVKIDELLTLTEKERGEMYEHVLNLKRYN